MIYTLSGPSLRLADPRTADFVFLMKCESYEYKLPEITFLISSSGIKMSESSPEMIEIVSGYAPSNNEYRIDLFVFYN